MDLRRVFDCMISVSELGRGQASKVIQAVEDEGNPYIIVKNNKPQAVIISINEYTELMRLRDEYTSQTMPSEIYPHTFHDRYSPMKMNTLSDDEINIFLENEEND
ncbi:type II toxin-antitoxin system Phd/YefM family antitoxin [Dehalobacter sp. DCM]|uniref:type II toxin-antitoxin system Phd/YefM family antitoxin n=1 Tax=Dehalobacter sp. DCM TaxID=2907827 RepID=UPI003081D5A4|nr:type II toxin-antitoxin system Phd/YefM family antitoxin [Dehalobacter sp. DCM]